MWPRSCERGILPAREANRIIEALLQCGRAHVSAESVYVWSDPRGAFRLQCGRAHVSAESQLVSPGALKGGASMWPRSCERGIKIHTARYVDMTKASMWPRSCERGIRCWCRRFKALIGASMWPRSCERGSRQLQLASAHLRQLQCGRAHVSAESRITSQSTGNIGTELQCGRAHVSAESMHTVAPLNANKMASMWPRSCERGIR